MQKYLEKLSRQQRCKKIFDKLGKPPSVMANLLDSGDNGGSSRGFGRSSERRPSHFKEVQEEEEEPARSVEDGRHQKN